jgi:GTP-binding protein EngB required for normal cell division
MGASNLVDALNNFTLGELIFDPSVEPKNGQRSEFYIDRENNPFDEIKTLLISSRTFDKILFSGHMGSGKSTELNRLTNDPDIIKNFLIVKYSVKETLDIYKINYIDLLISIGAEIFIEAVNNRVKIDNKLIKKLNAWKNSITEKTHIREKGRGAETQAGLKAFFASFTIRLKREHTTREAVRTIIEPKLSELIDLINSIVDSVKAGLPSGKDLLVVIDDLEKIPNIEDASKLYHDTGLYLTEPHCKIIYTVPIALHYSPRFKTVINTFGVNRFFPNIRILDKDGKRDDKTSLSNRRMKEFIYKRMDRSLIEEDALNLAIDSSGGVMRELVRIMQESCIKALTRKRDKINNDLVKESISSIRNDFGRMLSEKHYKTLKRIRSDKMAGSEDIDMDLLQNLSVIEYLNNERWCDVNPIVLPLLEEWGRLNP